MTDQKPATTLDAAFVEKTYGEAMALVHRSAHYLGGEGAAFRSGLDDAMRPVFTAESLRVTTRLMQVVSWLMTQRAALEGEMTQDEANAQEHRLGAADICLAEPLEGSDELPEVFQEIADSSLNLYRRIARIEDGLIGGAAPANPVHSLISRLDG
ncbi:MAG: DUF1465 family protein [Sphingomonadales bacterium]